MQTAKCGSCGGLVKFDATLAGHHLNCPHCQQPFLMEPLVGAPLPMKVELSDRQFDQIRSVMMLFVGSAMTGAGLLGNEKSGFGITLIITGILGAAFSLAGAVSFLISFFLYSRRK